MNILNDCSTCASCEDIISDVNSKLINIADRRLYNIRYELNREVDYKLYALLRFYKSIVSDICEDADCGCYVPEIPHFHREECDCNLEDGCQRCKQVVQINQDPATPRVNTCICGCCTPPSVTCTDNSWWTLGYHKPSNRRGVLSYTKDQILERAKILSV